MGMTCYGNIGNVICVLQALFEIINKQETKFIYYYIK